MQVSSSSGDPAIGVSDNNVYVIWSDLFGGPTEIIYRTSTDGGTIFESESSNVSADSGSSDSPSIAVS
jgi:hypothetical protein